MDDNLIALLKNAKGKSEHVIAINLDIRQFTPFCKTVESVDVATYITYVYTKIITQYFPNASFYKPSGDGLIIIIPHTKKNLDKLVNTTIDSCLQLLDEFGTLCDDNPMINYPVPDKVGIGISRGSICCIMSEDNKIIDYSGKLLNLTTRLMDVARPSGIVFDFEFGKNVLKNELKDNFSEEEIYIRGISENKPINVCYTNKHTMISDFNKNPLKEPIWDTIIQKHDFGYYKKVIGKWNIQLNKKPINIDRIYIRISHNKIENGEITQGMYTV